MLVLSRKINERIFIGDNIVITITSIDRGKVRIGVEAPKDVTIYREEIAEKLLKEETDAGD